MYVIVYDVIMPYGCRGSDHVREMAVELRTAALKSLGGSPGAERVIDQLPQCILYRPHNLSLFLQA